ncbi:MAG: hypothetical protein OEY59_11680 [Deltaproteobacteria bacterium]|nr:hypothetical protein [Deltaproteobacteria bacterium]
MELYTILIIIVIIIALIDLAVLILDFSDRFQKEKEQPDSIETIPTKAIHVPHKNKTPHPTPFSF